MSPLSLLSFTSSLCPLDPVVEEGKRYIEFRGLAPTWYFDLEDRKQLVRQRMTAPVDFYLEAIVVRVDYWLFMKRAVGMNMRQVAFAEVDHLRLVEKSHCKA